MWSAKTHKIVFAKKVTKSKRKHPKSEDFRCFSGAAGRIRTADLILTKVDFKKKHKKNGGISGSRLLGEAVPAVDNRLCLDYTEHRSEGATGKRLAPYLITEVTAGREAGRLLLFIGLDEQGNNGND